MAAVDHMTGVIVGNDGGTNVGASLLRAARSMDLDVDLLDTRRAYDAPALVAKFNWWVRDRRPSRLRQFSEDVVEHCRANRPAWLIATGLAPLDRAALEAVQTMGVKTVVYLTDDPWNPAFCSRWFLEALGSYARVFTARRSNIGDLVEAGQTDAEFLPFGADPDLFYVDPAPPDVAARYDADVFFAGGADADRRPYIAALLEAGLSVALYGDYWERFPETRAVTRGHADARELRRAVHGARVCLCLVRRANRDGHSMRSIEVPAAGGCMLAEDTEEHREIFGEPQSAAAYFRTIPDMVARARELLASPDLRMRMRAKAHEIVSSGFTYADRLRVLIAAAEPAHAYRDRRARAISRV